MTKQPESLRLADSIEDIQGLNTIDGTLVDHAARELRRLHEVNREAATELRRLHEVNAQLLKTLEHFVDANYLAWDAPCNTAESFHDWVRSRSQLAIAKAQGETEYD